MTSLSLLQPNVWTDYIGYTVTRFFYFPLTTLAFLTKMSEKRKSKLSSAIQLENWRKTISIEEKLDIINGFKKVNELWTYAVMLYSLVVA